MTDNYDRLAGEPQPLPCTLIYLNLCTDAPLCNTTFLNSSINFS